MEDRRKLGVFECSHTPGCLIVQDTDKNNEVFRNTAEFRGVHADVLWKQLNRSARLKNQDELHSFLYGLMSAACLVHRGGKILVRDDGSGGVRYTERDPEEEKLK